MRMFELHRVEDKSGVSGTGVVAEGVCFTDGTAVMRWRTQYRSTAFYSNMDELEAIHGHGGSTKVVWKAVVWGEAAAPPEPPPAKPKSFKELLNLDDSPLDSDFNSFEELWADLLAYVEKHPYYQFLCADDPGFHTRRIPRMGWVAYETPETATSNPAKEWTIPLTKLKTSLARLGSDTETSVLARMTSSGKGRQEVLESVVRGAREEVQFKKFTGA